MSDGGAAPVGHAVAATSVRNPTAILGKAAFDQFDRFDKLTAGKLTAGKLKVPNKPVRLLRQHLHSPMCMS